MHPIRPDNDLARFLATGIERLAREDAELFGLLEEEYRRQASVLTMVASSSIADPTALVCEAMPTMNVTAEGYPRARFHAGCGVIDQIEQLAIDRAKTAFGARYANVQPMSATSANEVVMFSVLEPHDTLLGLELDSGGHLTHGAKASISGQVFRAIGYGLTRDERIDYDQAERLAKEHRPKLIVCGTTAYPRQVDWARFRAIADEVGAYLLADITHIAGLVAAGRPRALHHDLHAQAALRRARRADPDRQGLRPPGARRQAHAGRARAEKGVPLLPGRPEPERDRGQGARLRLRADARVPAHRPA